MIRWLLGLLLSAVAVAAVAQDDPAQLPWGQGFPVVAQIGVAFVGVEAIDENLGNFTGTVDMRLRWRDLRLALPADSVPAEGYIELLEEKAEKKLGEIWHPHVEFGNIIGKPSYQKRSLRIYANGRAELMQRTTASFKADFPLENFPFDRQKLGVHLISRIEPTQRVLLDFVQDELEFSNTRYITEIDGWSVGLVELKPAPVPAWRGDENTGVIAALNIRRDQPSLVATIFIPLFSSLLIPLLTIWLNKVEDGAFAVDAFELTNISIGGLFAVVGLNFTINSSFVNLAVGDNPVMRLFGLNYFLLGFTIALGILMYRFNVLRRMFNADVQQEAFICMNWAIPLLTFVTAFAMVALAVF